MESYEPSRGDKGQGSLAVTAVGSRVTHGPEGGKKGDEYIGKEKLVMQLIIHSSPALFPYSFVCGSLIDPDTHLALSCQQSPI